MSDIDIQAHLYRAFLAGDTADVALYVKGTWQAVYHLHRVVLIQSDFFKSLFTSGFSESSEESEIDLVFDDYNITRPAFEICIARLYGGGPNLHISPSLVPTRNDPLTPNYPKPSSREETPAGHHPATPRFLLSLLATSIYLSIPSIVSQCLNSILDTIGPRTIIAYLDFALGKPLEDPQNWEPQAAVGLESVARIPPSSPTGTLNLEDDSAAYAIIKDSNLDSPSMESPPSPQPTLRPCANYGPISIRIGEAATCWLARWAPDTLAIELGHVVDEQMPSATWGPIANRRPRSHTLPATAHDKPPTEKRVVGEHVPVIWNRKGLSAQWVRALVSSDTLFVKGELERYHFARDVIELRRQGGILEEEETEWSKLFAEGIYYSNMLTEDMLRISNDVSPTTGKPYIPLEILQKGLWDQSVFRHTIMGSSTRPESPSVPRDKELGITSTTSEILNRLSVLQESKSTPYWRVPVDRSSRHGDASSREAATMDQLFDMPQHSSKSSPPLPPSSEKNFFGLLADRHTAVSSIEADPTGKACWSPHPPMRFAVEFWDVDHLKEKSRLHSHTVFYAGSLFNVYVQVVKKKGIQLGVYLHRQSSVDLIPPSSIPAQLVLNSPPSAPEPERATSPPPLSNRRPTSSPTIHYSPSIHPISRSTTPHSSSGSPSGSGIVTGGSLTLPALASPVAPVQPYRDPRSAILAFFTISCASSIGYSLSKFSSAPDVFAVSQSWGWKSSTLHTEDYMDVTPPAPGNTKLRKKEMSLRVTVVLGIV